jgi:hypothetical protein
VATDTPNLYLDKLIRLLTSARGVGRADRVREGYAPYSRELDFRDVDEATATARVAWARDQAPYAQIEVVPASGAAGLLTVFARVDLEKLALYLVERVLLQETGQTWQTTTGALPAIVRTQIITSFGAGASWQTLLDRIRTGIAWLTLSASIIGDANPTMPWLLLVHDALARTIPADAQAALLADLAQQRSLLEKMLRALETGEYLK